MAKQTKKTETDDVEVTPQEHYEAILGDIKMGVITTRANIAEAINVRNSQGESTTRLRNINGTMGVIERQLSELS